MQNGKGDENSPFSSHARYYTAFEEEKERAFYSFLLLPVYNFRVECPSKLLRKRLEKQDSGRNQVPLPFLNQVQGSNPH